LVILLLVVSLGGCGSLGKLFKRGKTEEVAEPETQEKQEQAPVRLVGEIASVHASEGFVLIRRYAQGSFGVGQLISGMSPDGTHSSLQLTGEKLGQRYAADIRSGTPKEGDLVIARSLPEESLAPSTPVPERPKGPEDALWMKNIPAP
jgi:hypothetical protein